MRPPTPPAIVIDSAGKSSRFSADGRRECERSTGTKTATRSSPPSSSRSRMRRRCWWAPVVPSSEEEVSAVPPEVRESDPLSERTAEQVYRMSKPARADPGGATSAPSRRLLLATADRRSGVAFLSRAGSRRARDATRRRGHPDRGACQRGSSPSRPLRADAARGPRPCNDRLSRSSPR
jgi:hypothetical protein